MVFFASLLLGVAGEMDQEDGSSFYMSLSTLICDLKLITPKKPGAERPPQVSECLKALKVRRFAGQKLEKP